MANGRERAWLQNRPTRKDDVWGTLLIFRRECSRTEEIDATCGGARVKSRFLGQMRPSE